jgi:hypothetical protein
MTGILSQFSVSPSPSLVHIDKYDKAVKSFPTSLYKREESHRGGIPPLEKGARGISQKSIFAS